MHVKGLSPPLSGRWADMAHAGQPRRAWEPRIVPCLACAIRGSVDDSAIRVEMERRVKVWLKAKGL